MEDPQAVGRSGSTEDEHIAAGMPRGFEQPPERLRGGDRCPPAVVALAIAAVLALLAWQPWGSDHAAIVAPGSPAPAIARADSSRAPSSAANGTDAPPAPVADQGTADSAFYVSITDNEWTVVALLTPVGPASSEEPASQHTAGAAWSPAGPFLVLQQGLIPVQTPVERAGDPGAPCIGTGVPRDRNAVPLPAHRVAYLGVTIPGTVPRAEVAAARLGGPAGTLTRATSPTVELAGMRAGRRYLIPSSGPGGAILFALTPPGLLPSGAYRFEVASPGADGSRYLYACIAP